MAGTGPVPNQTKPNQTELSTEFVVRVGVRRAVYAFRLAFDVGSWLSNVYTLLCCSLLLTPYTRTRTAGHHVYRSAEVQVDARVIWEAQRGCCTPQQPTPPQT